MNEKKDIHDFLMDAKRIVFLTPEKNNNIPTVFILFDNLSIAGALYYETVRVNKQKEQHFGFKKSSSSIILSFILNSTGQTNAKMLLDYNESEFDDFIKKVDNKTKYLVLYGQMTERGERLVSMGCVSENDLLMFNEYRIDH